MTIIDRFSTSFNWTEVNFGSVWLRPGFFYFTNGAITDQLGGGLTFVTGGSWMQAAPAYFALAKNSLFVGTTQFDGSPYAKRSGPILRIAESTPLQPELTICTGGKICRLPEEGTGYWAGLFQPKRLLNIYDGPAFADGNTYLNVGSWECDPQPCAGKTPAECYAALPCASDDPTCKTKELPCGIYGSTRQPTIDDPLDKNPGHRMIVLDAAIGWKQPNGFYYPPSFAHRASGFFASPPPAPEGKATNGLNQCYAPAADGTLALRPGDCRHNVIDRTSPYIAGSYTNVLGSAQITPVNGTETRLDVSPIDFQTILVDVDGTLTGAQGKLAGTTPLVPTVSLSRNAFFDAPVQSPECVSFGVQTTPYQAVTSVVAPMAATPTQDVASNVALTSGWVEEPMVAIYRQFLLAGEKAADCGQVCGGTGNLSYGCSRASFMMGPSVWEAPHLTLSVPSGVTEPANGMYYIDTSTAAKQPVDCVKARPGGNKVASFVANGTYVVYNLFAKSDTKTSYSVYVGATKAADVKPTFVRVSPHETSGGDFRNVRVTFACDPTAGPGWCAGAATVDANGILTFTLDQSKTKDRFPTAAKKDYERCLPRDVCYFDEGAGKCRSCLTHPEGNGCLKRSFVPADVTSMNQKDAHDQTPLDVLCEDWSTYASGAVANTPGETSFAECPAEGCLGVTFTLPSTFVGDKLYADVKPPVTCFDQAEWTKNALVPRTDGNAALVDPLCGAPRPPKPADFCAGP